MIAWLLLPHPLNDCGQNYVGVYQQVSQFLVKNHHKDNDYSSILAQGITSQMNSAVATVESAIIVLLESERVKELQASDLNVNSVTRIVLQITTTLAYSFVKLSHEHNHHRNNSPIPLPNRHQQCSQFLVVHGK